MRINELQPGVIATKLSNKDPVGTAVAESKVLMGRSGRPEDTAEAICFLVSRCPVSVDPGCRSG